MTRNLSFSKHSAVIGAFGREFIKTGIFLKELHEFLVSGFEVRQLGNYGVPGSIGDAKARTINEQAIELIETIEKYLKKEVYDI